MEKTHNLTQESDGYVQDEDVGDDHDQHPAYLVVISNNEIQSRIQDQRLSGYHPPPTDADDAAGNMSVLQYPKVEQKEAQRMNGAAPGRQQ